MSSTPQGAVMNFLNEVSGNFPDATSFAAGRPTDAFFDRLCPAALADVLSCYEAYHKDRGGAHHSMLQYGRTAGMIDELVAAQLNQDEAVPASPDRLIVTAGCQEAIVLCMGTLCPEPSDVALVCNPTYIGAIGAANACHVAVVPLTGQKENLALDMERTVADLRGHGRRARLLYLIPDFDNPTGRVIDRAQRLAILEVCAREHIVVLEDNPYGMFRYEGTAVPAMAALDEAGSVIYLSTYSKTLSPALRVGSMTLPKTLFGDQGEQRRLFQELVERKSFLTVNTGQITQAMTAGLLLQQGGSLRQWIQPAVDLYHNNRNVMLQELERMFGSMHPDIGWNRPEGGFFLTLDLPFRFDAEAVAECASEQKVIVMPMSFFALDASQDFSIRLAFSSVTPAQISEGIRRLGQYVAQRLEATQAYARSAV